MSIEQWGILALLILLPLLEGVARMRRARAGAGQTGGAGAPVAPTAASRRRPPPSSRQTRHEVIQAVEQTIGVPPPIPPAHRSMAVGRALASPGGSSTATDPFAAPGRDRRFVRGDGVVQWLRQAPNLRRAIIVTTILGPPSR